MLFMRNDLSFLLSQRIDSLVCMFTLRVQRIPSFLVLMFWMMLRLFISMEIPIQLNNSSSIEAGSQCPFMQPIFCKFKTKLVFSFFMLNLKKFPNDNWYSFSIKSMALFFSDVISKQSSVNLMSKLISLFSPSSYSFLKNYKTFSSKFA